MPEKIDPEDMLILRSVALLASAIFNQGRSLRDPMNAAIDRAKRFEKYLLGEDDE